MESSCTIFVATTRKPNFPSVSLTAGPERSTRSPREQESLTVTTAAVKLTGASLTGSTIEEDIFFLFSTGAATRSRTARRRRTRSRKARCRRRSARSGSACAGTVLLNAFRAALALRLVEQAQTLHQQALGVELGGFLIGLALEVEFE